MMVSDVCLTSVSDVCRVHPAGGRRVRPAGWDGAYLLIGPGSVAWLKAAAACFWCRVRGAYCDGLSHSLFSDASHVNPSQVVFVHSAAMFFF